MRAFNDSTMKRFYRLREANVARKVCVFVQKYHEMKINKLMEQMDFLIVCLNPKSFAAQRCWSTYGSIHAWIHLQHGGTYSHIILVYVYIYSYTHKKMRVFVISLLHGAAITWNGNFSSQFSFISSISAMVCFFSASQKAFFCLSNSASICHLPAKASTSMIVRTIRRVNSFEVPF